MRLKTEFENEKEHILIIESEQTSFTDQLKNALLKYDNSVYVSPILPDDITLFSTCFYINQPLETLLKILHSVKKHHIFIFLGKNKLAQEYIKRIEYFKKTNLKVILIDQSFSVNEADLEKILWFSFRPSNEIALHIKPEIKEKIEEKVQKKHTLSWSPFIKKYIRLRTAPVFFFILIFICHFLFIPPLILANIFYYQSLQSFQTKHFKRLQIEKSIAYNSLVFSKSIYTVFRPTYLILSLSASIDDIIQTDETLDTTLDTSVVVYNQGTEFVHLLLKKDKSSEEKTQIITLKLRMQSEIDDLNQNISYLVNKLPEWTPDLKNKKYTLQDISSTISTINKVIPQMDSIFGANAEKKYLILFANNAQIRPGGGFISGYGVLKVKDYTLEEFKIYDVYEADNKLTTHIDPPDPIKYFLNENNWYLRDSAFSPDFYENYIRAKTFLQQEANLSQFDGGILVTNTAIQNMLESMGNLHISDFNELVNKDNFYLKLRLYSDSNYFPGSQEKSQFLSDVVNQMILKLENASLSNFFKMIKKSADEKQMIFYFEDENVQKVMNSQYWSGLVINPTCNNADTNCIVDYQFPLDSNFASNSANLFVKRSQSSIITIDSGGNVKNKILLKIQNDSLPDSQTSGIYKNYFQILLPKNAAIERITKDDTLVDDYKIIDGIHKTVGFLMEIPAQKEVNISIQYVLPTPLEKGSSTYQLIVQKQTGMSNTDFSLIFHFPKNMKIVSKNFSALVKDNTILYNTSITTDKIFLVELLKD